MMTATKVSDIREADRGRQARQSLSAAAAASAPIVERKLPDLPPDRSCLHIDLAYPTEEVFRRGHQQFFEARHSGDYFKAVWGLHPIVGQAETTIGSDDTIATLHARIDELGMDLMRNCIPKIADGSVTLRPQDESMRRLFPQRSPQDGLIASDQPAQSACMISSALREDPIRAPLPPTRGPSSRSGQAASTTARR